MYRFYSNCFCLQNFHIFCYCDFSSYIITKNCKTCKGLSSSRPSIFIYLYSSLYSSLFRKKYIFSEEALIVRYIPRKKWSLFLRCTILFTRSDLPTTYSRIKRFAHLCKLKNNQSVSIKYKLKKGKGEKETWTRSSNGVENRKKAIREELRKN